MSEATGGPLDHGPPVTPAAQQLAFETEWTKDRIEENKLVNDIRARVALWRRGGYVGVTPTTARLLAHWTATERTKRLFFCQIEALETAIYLTEVAGRYGDGWIENALRAANDTSKSSRRASPSATGCVCSSRAIPGPTMILHMSSN